MNQGVGCGQGVPICIGPANEQPLRPIRNSHENSAYRNYTQKLGIQKFAQKLAYRNTNPGNTDREICIEKYLEAIS